MASDFLLKETNISAICRWPTLTAEEWVTNYIKTVIDDEDVFAVIGVGSAVRENVKYSNDIDILSIIKKEKEYFKRRSPIEVDHQTYKADELESKIINGHDYLGWAVKYGRVLHEKNNFWSDLVLRLSDRLPFPSVDVALERAKSAYRYAKSFVEIGDEDAAAEQLLTLLTHFARAILIKEGIYPASRPELPEQLKLSNYYILADLLSRAMMQNADPAKILEETKTYNLEIIKDIL